MNNITIFNNDLFGEVRTMLIEEEAWFVGKDVAEALGYKDVAHAILDHVDEDDRVNSKTQGQNNPEFGQRGTWLINESGLYSLIFGSKKPEAKAFKKWVTSEVLPTLRKSGVFITESATQETIDYQARYGKYRIRKTFENTKDIRAEYEQYFELSKIECKAHHINNKDRINGSKIIINMIQEKIANEVQDMRPSELLALQELVNDIQTDITKLSNKLNGGQKSALTKQIKRLEQQVEELTPMDLVFTTIDIHPFTTNCMYEIDQTGKTHRSEAYNKWINKFPAHQVPTVEEYIEYENIDFNAPIGIEIRYICKDGFDVDNLNKATIDMIFNRIFRVDDNIVKEVKATRIENCNIYTQGKIIFAIYNI